MIKVCVGILLVFATFTDSSAQKEINYGSNAGKHLIINKTKIYYEEYGKGTPLLLLHGGLQSIHDFQEIIPTLSKRFRVIAFDRPFHGRSEPIDSLSYHIMANYAIQVIDQLKLDSVYLMGWSDGGSTALLTASMRPEKVKKIIVCGTDMNEDEKGSQPIDNLRMITPEFVEKNWKEWLTGYQQLSPQPDQWKKFISKTVKMWLKIDYISEAEMRALKCKTLLIVGDRDVVKPEVAIKMHRLIKGSQLCILPNTTHFMLAEKPELIGRLALDFLK
ncbi:MAG: alpha/beta hydrolase [Bacteroidetes bacterium]|nr:alpha/beta hydrolase [Bacteroidota bacterium]